MAEQPIWAERRACIDSFLTRIVHSVPDRAILLDDWEIQWLAVQLSDGQVMFHEALDGSIIIDADV